MKLLSIIFLLLFSYSLSFGSSALSALRKSERSSTLKEFKIQMKSRLSNASMSRSASRHRSSSVSHNNRFIHQSTQEMKQLSKSSSSIQNSAISQKEHYEMMYEQLDQKYKGNKKEIADEMHNYMPFEEAKEYKDDDVESESKPDEYMNDERVEMPRRSVIWGRR